MYKNNYILAIIIHVQEEFAVLDTHTIECIIQIFQIYTSRLSALEKERALIINDETKLL